MEPTDWERLRIFIQESIKNRALALFNGAFGGMYVFRDVIFAGLPVSIMPYLGGVWIVAKGIFITGLSSLFSAWVTHHFNKYLKSKEDGTRSQKRKGKKTA